jgi:hypothetical protein
MEKERLLKRRLFLKQKLKELISDLQADNIDYNKWLIENNLAPLTDIDVLHFDEEETFDNKTNTHLDLDDGSASTSTASGKYSNALFFYFWFYFFLMKKFSIKILNRSERLFAIYKTNDTTNEISSTNEQ